MKQKVLIIYLFFDIEHIAIFHVSNLYYDLIGMKIVWGRRREFQITESVQYYFNKIDVIKMPNYIPDKVRAFFFNIELKPFI
jgi:hypothetical protein